MEKENKNLNKKQVLEKKRKKRKKKEKNPIIFQENPWSWSKMY